MQAAGPYTIWHPGRAEAGPHEDGGTARRMMSNEKFPPEAPPYWLVYFAVEDADATVASAEELGGSVMAPAFDAPGSGGSRC